MCYFCMYNNFRKTQIALFACMVVALSACKKEVIPQPDFILQYDSPAGSYNAVSQYRWETTQNYQLLPFTAISYIGASSADSILIRFTSTIQDRGGHPGLEVSFSKLFSRNQLDSLSGRYIIKNEADFYNVFKTGSIAAAEQVSGVNREGLEIRLQDLKTYVLGGNVSATLPAYSDTANLSEVSTSEKNIDFAALAKLGIVTENPVRLIMVDVKFKCKLFNKDLAGDSLILTNGRFQGFFQDR